MRIGVWLVAALPAAAGVQGFAPFSSETAFFSELSALRVSLRGELLASRVVRRHTPGEGLTHEEALALVLERLKGSDVPEDYARAAFADPRVKLIADIPDRFKVPKPQQADYDEVRKRVITEARIAAGADFYRDRLALLARVSAQYGVDGGALAGLAGIETFYGRSAGGYPVFSALYTITRQVPSRTAWAAAELAEYLKLCRADSIDPGSLRGSYAGAFGFVQFMPSSFNRWAVDFDGDGRRRLDEWPDALASAANYLKSAGWEAGGSLAPGSRNWRAIHAYNHSDTYVRLVLDLRQAILDRQLFL